MGQSRARGSSCSPSPELAGSVRLASAATESTSAYLQLALIYFGQGRPDSAAAVLRESMAKPETHTAQTPFQIAYADSRVDPKTGLRSLR